eukprot:TRINITY_DN284_c0_g1_i2.p1 TRINITY_DN284_c0_g1~~TRINITY_DN284_c0_g1_i2.p1  ORF type:complete len:265 (-),score=74.15 TRINITY_DN284_c0_g1_i2:1620-2414(-)
MSREPSPEPVVQDDDDHHNHGNNSPSGDVPSDRHRNNSPSPAAPRSSSSSGPAKEPQKVFIGNLPTEVRRNQVVDLFKDLGEIVSIDLKNGFAFVELDGDIHAAIRKLDRMEFEGRQIRVELSTSAAREQRQREKRDMRQSSASRCLFVANFGPRITERVLEDLFSPYGKIARIAINAERKNFAFIEFENVDDASAALKALHKYPFQERELTVEYSDRDSAPRPRRSPPPSSYRDRDSRYDRRRSRTPPRGGRYDDRRRARSRS